MFGALLTLDGVQVARTLRGPPSPTATSPEGSATYCRALGVNRYDDGTDFTTSDRATWARCPRRDIADEVPAMCHAIDQTEQSVGEAGRGSPFWGCLLHEQRARRRMRGRHRHCGRCRSIPFGPRD